MCGRARCTLGAAQAARAFGFPTTSAAGGGGGDTPAVPTLHMDRFRPSYNVSPGAYLPVGAIRARPGGGGYGGGGAEDVGPVIQCMKWGLVPSFTGKTEKPDHFRMFNARSESVKEKASFRRLIPKNRCLVAVEGFYEWKKDGSKKQPYYIHFQDHRPLVFAALYDTWTNSEGEAIYSFTVLTTGASTSLKWLHDRMPVILGNKDSISAWLNNGSIKLEEVTAPYEAADLVWYPVAPAMGKTSFDGPECIIKLPVGSSEKPISKFFAKKSTAHDQQGKPDETSHEFTQTNAPRAAKVESHEPVEYQSVEIEEQQPRDKLTVKHQTVILEPQILEKSHSIKHEDIILPTNVISAKRKIQDSEFNLDTKMKNMGHSPLQPVKKEKGSKAASDGQASLLSYFAKK